MDRIGILPGDLVGSLVSGLQGPYGLDGIVPAV
jgi:hypothetical protein